ncbi:MAG: hypothetical protein WCH34_11245, partial [Bacteroidota bacterium]
MKLGKLFSSMLFFGMLIFLMTFVKQTNAQNCTVNSGVDASLCPNQLMQLHGSSAGLYIGNGNIHWVQKNGPAVYIVDPYNMDTYVNGFTAGNTYEFYLYAKCSDGSLVRDSVVYTVWPLSTADAGIDQASCPGTTVLTLEGNMPNLTNNESGKWQPVGPNNAGVSFVDDTQYDTKITLSPTSCGVTTLRWTIFGPNSCQTYDDVLITNYGGVTPVTAGPDETVGGCYSTTTSTTLRGSYGGCGLNAQSGHWTLVSGPNIPTIANPNSGSSAVSKLIEGTYRFRWDVTGPCASGTAFVNIIVPHALGGVTGASAGASQTFCDGRTTFTLTGNNPLHANEKVRWVRTGGPFPVVIANDSIPITTVTVPSTVSGTYTFSYTIRDTLTNCSSSSSTSITYNIPPTITLDASPTIPCDDSIATVDYVLTGNGSLEWSIVGGPTNDYYPTIPTAWFAGTTSPQLIYHLSGVGTYTIRFRVVSGTGSGCSTATADVGVTTSQSPWSSNSGTPQFLACNVTQTNLAGNKVQNNKGHGRWTAVRWPGFPELSDPGFPAVMADDTLFNTLITELHPGIYRF